MTMNKALLALAMGLALAACSNQKQADDATADAASSAVEAQAAADAAAVTGDAAAADAAQAAADTAARARLQAKVDEVLAIFARWENDLR